MREVNKKGLNWVIRDEIVDKKKGRWWEIKREEINRETRDGGRLSWEKERGRSIGWGEKRKELATGLDRDYER